MKHWIQALALTVGCGGLPADSEPSFDEAYPITGPDVAFSCSEPWCDTVRWGVARINASTGWRSRVTTDPEEPAIPVIFPSSAEASADVLGKCGITQTWHPIGSARVLAVGGIEVPAWDNPGACQDIHRTLTHELFHAACGLGGHAQCHGECVTFGDTIPCHRITDGDLDAVCQRWGCPARRPEPPRIGSVVYPARPDL